LSSGRVVILRDGVRFSFPPLGTSLTCHQHFRNNNIAILLKTAPVTPLDTGLLARVKTYFVLARVHPDTKKSANGIVLLPSVQNTRLNACIGADVGDQAIPPIWPIDPNSLKLNDSVYELRAVASTSIAAVTNRTIKVSGRTYAHLSDNNNPCRLKRTKLSTGT